MSPVRLGALQVTGLVIYVLDDAHEQDHSMRLDGAWLHVSDVARARDVLTDAANSADVDGDRPVCAALTSLCSRLAK